MMLLKNEKKTVMSITADTPNISDLCFIFM